MAEDISICTVSYNSAPFIKINHRLVESKNPGVKTRWIVAENSDPNSDSKLQDGEISACIIPGASGKHIPIYHHTIALNSCIELTKSRFVVIIDPDFLVIMDSWITKIIDHMKTNDLSIFAVPWHPKSGSKYRYFPAVHFSVFDTERFDRKQIDFRPDYPDGNDDPAWPNGWEKERSYFCSSRSTKILSLLPFLRSRKRFYTDTGSRLYKKYVNDKKVKFELVTPIFNRNEAMQQISLQSRFIEIILPDELCYYPKKYESDTLKSFLAPLVTNNIPQNWEEFAWKKKPFGFHIRGNLDRTSRNKINEIDITRKVLEAI